MLIDRRSFMQATALVAVGDLLLLSSHVRAYASSISNFVPTQMAVDETSTKHVFKVDGWDRREDLSVECSGCRPQILWAPIWPAMKSSSELIRHGVLLGDDLVNQSQCWGAHRHVFTKDWLPNPYAGASSTITSKILGLVFIGSSLLECRRAIPIANHTDVSAGVKIDHIAPR